MSAHANVDREAERSVLGALLLESGRTLEIAALLHASDFSEERHAQVFESIVTLVKRGDPIDFVTVGNDLARKTRLRSVGGRAYLAELASTVNCAAHLLHHARIVAACACARRTAVLLRSKVAMIETGTPSQADLEEIAGDVSRVVRTSVASPSNLERQRVELVRMSDVQPQKVEWLWEGRIAIGKLTLLAGDPGLGKSFLTIDIAARVSRGSSLPDDPGTPAKPGSVILLSAEDDPEDTILPRLIGAGADTSKVHLVKCVASDEPGTRKKTERVFNLERDLPALECALIEHSDVRLIGIDPISAYTGKTDSHRNTDVRALLAPLAAFAAKYRVAILAVTHLNKNSEGPAIYRAMGSLAFAAAARSVLIVSKDKDQPERRLVTIAKNNLAREALALAYSIGGSPDGGEATVHWEPEPVRMNADDALASDARSEERRTERDRARDFLYQELASGAVPSGDIHRRAKENNIAKKTLERAADEIGVKPKKSGFWGGWFWSLPNEDRHEEPQDRRSPGVGIFGEGGHLGAVGL